MSNFLSNLWLVINWLSLKVILVKLLTKIDELLGLSEIKGLKTNELIIDKNNMNGL